MQKTCSQCSAIFTVTDADLAFYKKISPEFNGKIFQVPPPTLCPDCRAQRRLAQFNRHFMYKRKSDATGKDIISIFSPEKKQPIYEQSYWWSDNWDPLTYGTVPDLQQPILPQIQQLIDVVPVMALINDQNENSPYINSSGWSKNCHWSWGVDYCEHVFYSESTYHSTDCIDCLFVEGGELCYECTDCVQCYNVLFAQNCENCHDSYFLNNCIGCKHCFGCVGLRQKEYCYYNQKITKQEYEKRMKQHLPLTIDSIQNFQKQLYALRLTIPHSAIIGTKNEEVSGNYLYGSKNAFECYDSNGLQDCKYCCNTRGANDCLDVSYWGHPGELLYECTGVGEGASNALFCYLVWGGTENMLYCNTCISCSNCFGCCGLRHKHYCIFNVQYTKEEYEKMVPKILEAMQNHAEWGECFSIENAVFCYNESLSHLFYPLSKEAVISRGWKWLDRTIEIPKVEKIIPADKLPRSIVDIPDDILNWAMSCKETAKPFKIEPKELEFYRAHNLPIPALHPEERLWNRWKQRNPRKLFDRTCGKCQIPIQTTYAPERPEIVYCERCYLETVY